MGYVLLFLMLAQLFTVIMLYRNNFVLKYRLKSIADDYEVYKRGPSYNKMWWDLRKWTYKQFYGEK